MVTLFTYICPAGEDLCHPAGGPPLFFVEPRHDADDGGVRRHGGHGLLYVFHRARGRAADERATDDDGRRIIIRRRAETVEVRK